MQRQNESATLYLEECIDLTLETWFSAVRSCLASQCRLLLFLAMTCTTWYGYPCEMGERRTLESKG